MTASLRPGLGGKGLPSDLAFLVLISFKEGRQVPVPGTHLLVEEHVLTALCMPVQLLPACQS